MKAEWSYASVQCGVQCVTMSGVLQMLWLCADN